MTKNQLFKMIPPRSLCLKILKTFGLNDFDDTHNFSRDDLQKINCIDNLLLLKDTLQEYYLPCKARTYLNDLNTKNAITILRQIVKLYGYTINSREKYIKGHKFIIYQLTTIENKSYNPINILSSKNNDKECIVIFD